MPKPFSARYLPKSSETCSYKDVNVHCIFVFNSQKPEEKKTFVHWLKE